MRIYLVCTLEMPKAINLCEKHTEILEASGFRFKAMREPTDFDCDICSCESKWEARLGESDKHSEDIERLESKNCKHLNTYHGVCMRCGEPQY